jgi:biopolymer transport protein ExbD
MSEAIIFARRPRRAPRIDLTALVDGVFNLLIFFAVTASFAGRQAGLGLKLPEAATAQTLKGHVIVGISANGTIRVDAKQVTLGQIGAEVVRHSAGNREAQIVVRPDKLVPYERLVAAMDEVRLVGYHNLALAAVKKRGP